MQMPSASQIGSTPLNKAEDAASQEHVQPQNLKRKREKREHPLDEMVKFEIDCVVRRTNELLEKYPESERDILTALDVSS